ncbi:hypothetical protein EJB05_19896, partial [Eragrostis curvula]
MKQVEDMRKELQTSWKAASDAESRATVAEARAEIKKDTLMKEKEEVIKVNQSLLKQIEDLKSSQKATSESTEQAVKEKDFRIQTLERRRSEMTTRKKK